MARPAEEVLAAWREAERLLDQIPEEGYERRLLQFEVARLRAAYRRLTGDVIPDSAAALKISRDSIEAAKLTLELARQRLRIEQGRQGEA